MLVKLLGSSYLILTVWLLLPVRHISEYVSGRSQCTFRESMAAVDESLLIHRARLRMREAGKPLRVDAGLELWQTPDGRYWTTRGNADSLNSALLEEAAGVYSVPGSDVRPGDIVLDCGANVGTFTRAALAKGAKLVVAIEPAPNHVECLQRNLVAEIGAGKVIVYPKGVWDKDDWLTLSEDPNNTAADSVVMQHGAGVKVPLTTIDKIVSELNLSRVDFIKMDIEGAERQALQGARSVISRFKPRMAICVYHLPDDPAVIPATIRAANSAYARCETCGEADRSIIRKLVMHFQ